MTINKNKNDKNTNWDIAVCGLNCAQCDLIKENKCRGCRGSLDCHWSADCKMLACAKEKAHRYCFECADFPCALILAFGSDKYPHHRKTVENLKRMKEIGMEAWIAEQPHASFCPGCLNNIGNKN